MNTNQRVSLGNGHAIGKGSSACCNNVKTITTLSTGYGNGVSPSSCQNEGGMSTGQEGLRGRQVALKWFLMRASYGREQKACSFLQAQDIEAFCPKWKQERVYGGKRVVVEVSIIPNTLFVRSTEAVLRNYIGKSPVDYLHHYYQRDVDENRMMRGLGRRPITIPDRQMELFRLWVETDSDDKIYQRDGVFDFKEGDLVRIKEGSFAGFTGYVVRFKGQTRVGITIDDVGTIFTAYIPKKLLVKIDRV